MKFYVTIIIIIIASITSSCESNIVKKTSIPEDCIFPNSQNIFAPSWICNFPVKGLIFSSVGSSQASTGNDFLNTKKIAIKKAKTSLLDQIKKEIQNISNNYKKINSNIEHEKIDQIFMSISNNITQQHFSNFRLYKTITSPQRYVYVLIGINKKNLEKITKNAIKISMKNNDSLWSELKTKKNTVEIKKYIFQYWAIKS